MKIYAQDETDGPAGPPDPGPIDDSQLGTGTWAPG